MVWQKSAGRLLKYVMIKFKTTGWHDLYGTSLYLAIIQNFRIITFFFCANLYGLHMGRERLKHSYK